MKELDYTLARIANNSKSKEENRIEYQHRDFIKMREAKKTNRRNTSLKLIAYGIFIVVTVAIGIAFIKAAQDVQQYGELVQVGYDPKTKEPIMGYMFDGEKVSHSKLIFQQAGEHLKEFIGIDDIKNNVDDLPKGRD